MSFHLQYLIYPSIVGVILAVGKAIADRIAQAATRQEASHEALRKTMVANATMNARALAEMRAHRREFLTWVDEHNKRHDLLEDQIHRH